MKSLIGKEWKDAKDGSVIEVKNPANNELVDTFKNDIIFFLIFVKKKLNLIEI